MSENVFDQILKELQEIKQNQNDFRKEVNKKFDQVATDSLSLPRILYL